MLKRITLALLLIATPAAAQSRLLCYGDSIFACGNGGAACPTAAAGSSICHKLKAMRPEIGLCINAVDGRNSTTALAWANFNYAWCSCGAGTCPPGSPLVADVYLEYGANDYTTITPTQTALNLREMAARAVAVGARPHILTPFPVGAGAVGSPARRNHVIEATKTLYELNLAGPAYDLVPANDFLTDSRWASVSCASDQVHVKDDTCRGLFAGLMEGHLPLVWP